MTPRRAARERERRLAVLRIAVAGAVAVLLLGGGAWLIERLLPATTAVAPLPRDLDAAPTGAPGDAAAAPPVLDAAPKAAPDEDAAPPPAPDAAIAPVQVTHQGGEDAGPPIVAAPPPRERLPGPAGGGRLHLVLRPAADVRVDGAEVGRAVERLELDLAAGVHLIEASGDGWPAPVRRRVRVKPGHLHRVDLRPSP